MTTRPRPRKSLGQHFLSDRRILGEIVDAADVTQADTVVEVGPGTGSLTVVLASRAKRVIAVELDPALAADLRVRALPNVDVVEADARTVHPGDLLGGCDSYKMLGNLPYYAAAPILRRFLEDDCPPSKVAILVQREVAQSMCAQPGDMALLSLGVQLFGRPRITRLVRPGSFNPPPKVTSAVVAIDVFPRPAEGIDDPMAFFHLARAGFAARRKQLGNALAQGLGVGPTDVGVLLTDAGIDRRRRAEDLAMHEWGALYRTWRASGMTSNVSPKAER